MALFAKQMDVTVTQVQILYSPPIFGIVAQLVAQTLDKRQVEGSSPSYPTNTLLLRIFIVSYIHIWAVSILGIMLRLHRREGSSILPRSTNF